MPMNQDQVNKWNLEGQACSLLEDKKAQYLAAKAALETVQATLATAVTDLNAAWIAAKTEDLDLSNMVFVPPSGWTPPAFP